MTAQIPEQIWIDGERCAMCSEPLDDYFRLSGEKPPFRSDSTALWRGYEGTWELLGERLYLVALRGTFENGTPAILEAFFPDFPDRVFAHWYSGQVRIPRGKLLRYVHGGYASTYEEDWLIRFEHGVVVERSVRRNGQAAATDAADGLATRP